jgi:hypothetical protein
MFFIDGFNGARFIFFCLIAYFLLFLSAFSFHLNPNILLNGITFDVRLLVMLLIAEPHFALTIPLLYGYRSNFKTNPTYYTLIPLLIIGLGSIIFFQMNNLFMLIFLVANIFHVNRQSGGFLMIQGKTPFIMKLPYEISLHLFTLVCLSFSLILQYHSVILGFSLFLLTNLTILIIFKLKNGFWPTIRQAIVMAQGYLIFLPLTIFSDILLAFAIGISIHYLQYLSIGWRVCKVGFGFSMGAVLFVICAYSVISTTALSGFITQDTTSIFILIPTMMQLLHFYYDSLIWRRKDPLIGGILGQAF